MVEPTGPPLTTLIVDDEPLALERMELICAGLPSLRVIGTARDGAAALAAIIELSPELVLLDMTMPELDGLAVARALTKSEALVAKLRSQSATCPIALLTGKAGTKDVDEKALVAAIEEHGLLFLQKPVTASIAASQFSAAFANR